MSRARVDQLLVERGLAPSKSRAQAMIMAGLVYQGELRIDKAGQLVAADAAIRVRAQDHAFVSRGGVKLEGALVEFKIDVTRMRAVDVGASTGGFTDCLLQRGAAHVVAVDVGYGQLAQKLRDDIRVTVRERTNARALAAEDVGGPADLVVVDASFISLAKLLPAIAAMLKPQGTLVALVKPQFEVGRDIATRAGGVIRDERERGRAIRDTEAAVVEAGFTLLATSDCVIPGPKGNREAFIHARRG
jgi:23S rRNA (cytidine1920-2'-O)/16S rRNA (cytidine1409-2'-O)-methyltransferase